MKQPRGPSILPVDHGWSWMVMIGAFVNCTCLLTFVRSWSMVFLRFLDRYQASATMTTLALGLSPAMFALSNFLQPVFFIPRFQVRTITLVGNVLHVVSILSIAFAPDIYALVIFFAVNGFAQGFVLVPQVTLLTYYFKKRLTMATAFSTLGVSIATILGPRFTQFLLDQYGLLGTVLMLAALCMHAIPASMLFRPLTEYSVIPTEIIDEEIFGKLRAFEADQVSVDKAPFETKECDCNALEDDTVQTNGSQHSLDPTLHKVDNNKLVFSVHGEKCIELTITAKSLREDNSIDETDCKEEKSEVLGFLKCSFHTEKPDDDDDSIDSEIDTRSCLVRIKESKYLNPLVLLIVISSGLGVHTAALISYTPALGLENGLDEATTPHLITVAGVCDLASKLLIGFFGDIRLVRPIGIVCFCLFLLGTTVQFVSYFQGLGLLMLMQVLVGLTTEAYYTMLPVITVSLLGRDYISHVLSGFFLFNGAITTMDSVVTGLLKDTTGSFHGGYHFMGGLALLGGVLLVSASVAVKLAKTKGWLKDRETVIKTEL